MPNISLRFTFPDMSRADEVVTGVTSFAVDEAIDIADRLLSTWGDQPYSFQYERSYINARGGRSYELSPTYYLGGTVRSEEQVRQENKPDEKILLQNMMLRGYRKVITTVTPRPATFAFADDGVLLDWAPLDVECRFNPKM